MSNLAVKYKQQAQEEVQIQTPPQQMVQPKAKAKITRIEKLLYVAFIGFLLYACVAFINVEAATIEQKIVQQQKENQELQAEVEKLSRYERIAEVAKKHGLEINANNVKGLK